MADRIFTSKKSEEILQYLQNITKLEFGALARIAFAISLKQTGKNVPRNNDTNGKEIRRASFFGNDELLFKNILFTAYKKKFEDDEFFSRQSVVKDHVDNGLLLLNDILERSNSNEIKFYENIAAELQGTKRAPKSQVHALKILIGKSIPDNQPIYLELNNTEKHTNPHLAIMGKPGSGKTQLLLKILADIRKQSGFTTNFILFDYKGDVTDNKKFIDATKATVYSLSDEPLPVNPFVLEDYNSRGILISAREKAEAFRSIESHFGPVQEDRLTDIIKTAYENRSKQNEKYPDFKEIFSVATDLYQEKKIKHDTLFGILRDLSEFNLFWDHSQLNAPISKLTEATIVVDVHSLPVLKELVAYLAIERLYKEMAVLPDSEILNGEREIRTILVIDEAHNYLSQKNLFLQKIVREGRSKGIAVFFASQSPDDYNQKSFDFKSLLEFCFIFQSEGMSAQSIQNLLACNQNVAKQLTTEISKLTPHSTIAKAFNKQDEFIKFESEPFHRAYKDN